MTTRVTDLFPSGTLAALPDPATVPEGGLYASSDDRTIYKVTAGVWAAWLSLPDTNTTDVEVVRDTIGAALVQGFGVTITVNDAGDTITISTAPSAVVLDVGQTVAQYQTAHGVTVPAGTLIARKA